ncbi:MAG: TM2 domain-containing protein [Bacteroidales bacterium]|jgi:TM2 domain-containing membrane protein YozV|nr:TM2 domain-containing protein [Bacteroidales bacterium]
MKKMFFLIVLIFAGKIWAQNTPEEALFCEIRDNHSGVQISKLEPLKFEIDTNSQLSTLNFQLKKKDPVVAWLISFPTGMLGLHRLYLGTDVKTMVFYIVTLGGVFGIVPMIDWILLLRGIQSGDISKYVNNRKFIMWF